jgi:hypothetical protein
MEQIYFVLYFLSLFGAGLFGYITKQKFELDIIFDKTKSCEDLLIMYISYAGLFRYDKSEQLKYIMKSLKSLIKDKLTNSDFDIPKTLDILSNAISVPNCFKNDLLDLINTIIESDTNIINNFKKIYSLVNNNNKLKQKIINKIKTELATIENFNNQTIYGLCQVYENITDVELRNQIVNIFESDNKIGLIPSLDILCQVYLDITDFKLRDLIIEELTRRINNKNESVDMLCQVYCEIPNDELRHLIKSEISKLIKTTKSLSLETLYDVYCDIPNYELRDEIKEKITKLVTDTIPIMTQEDNFYGTKHVIPSQVSHTTPIMMPDPVYRYIIDSDSDLKKRLLANINHQVETTKCLGTLNRFYHYIPDEDLRTKIIIKMIELVNSKMSLDINILTQVYHNITNYDLRSQIITKMKDIVNSQKSLDTLYNFYYYIPDDELKSIIITKMKAIVDKTDCLESLTRVYGNITDTDLRNLIINKFKILLRINY